MKTTSADQTYIDYWQDYGTGEKSHFGIRVWAHHCSVITDVGAKSPILFGDPHELPIDLLRNSFAADRMRQISYD